jgi:hypothetical protein
LAADHVCIVAQGGMKVCDAAHMRFVTKDIQEPFSPADELQKSMEPSGRSDKAVGAGADRGDDFPLTDDGGYRVVNSQPETS